MAVRKLKSGRWLADVVVGVKPDGRPDRRSKSCRTMREAQAAERALMSQRDTGSGVSGKVTFDDFVRDVYWPLKKGLRPDTVRGYERDIRLRLSPAFGRLELPEISRLRIQNMLDNCSTKKVATNARETLSSILGVAVDLEMLPRNPCSHSYSMPKPGERPPDADGAVLGTFAEHRAVLEYVRAHSPCKPIERILVLGLCFGLRKGEIFGLDWENVDLDAREIRITQTYVCAKGGAYLDEPKTPKSRRTIPMTAWAAERIAAWHEADGGDGASGPVLKTRAGRRMNPRTGSDCLKDYIRNNPVLDSGEPFPAVRIMSLRHSFATACIMAGIEVATVSRWLGHTQISTTYNRYVRPRLSDLHASAAAIDAAFSDGA